MIIISFDQRNLSNIQIIIKLIFFIKLQFGTLKLNDESPPKSMNCDFITKLPSHKVTQRVNYQAIYLGNSCYLRFLMLRKLLFKEVSIIEFFNDPPIFMLAY